MTWRPVLPSRLPVGSSARMSFGFGSQGAGQRDALLLAARKLRREMIDAGAETDLLEMLARDSGRVRAARKLERQRHVLERGHGRHEMERLEDDADVGSAGERQLVLAEGRKVTSGDVDLAARRPLEAGEYHQERRLAGAGGSDDGHGLAARDLEAHATQDFDRPGAARECQAHILEADYRLGHVQRAPKRVWTQGLPMPHFRAYLREGGALADW